MKLLLSKLLFFTLLAIVCNSHAVFSQTQLENDIDSAIVVAKIRLENTLSEIDTLSTLFPSETDPDSLKWDDSELKTSPYWWTSGYFPACYWMMYQISKEEKWKTWADKWTWGLESQKYRSDNADMGGIIYFSFGNGYKYTNNSEYLPVIDVAATTYSDYYNPDVGAIKCWESGWSKTQNAVVTDFLVYSEFMFSAYQLTGKKEYYDIVTNHLEVTMENNLNRDDGSCWQFVDFDEFGEPIGYINSSAYQGWLEGGTRWTRAHAWAINGLTQAYRYTHQDKYLQAAKKVADYFISQLPDDFVPPSDFDAPLDSINGRDASAAAIACSGLIELSEYADNTTYMEAAENILSSLCSSNYLTKTSGHSSILQRGQVRHSGPEIGLIYGDYFFLEAIAKYKGVYKYFMDGHDYINFAPQAYISNNKPATDSDLNGMEEVMLIGKYSNDPDGEITAFEWSLNDEVISDDDTLKYNFPVGKHNVTLTVIDNFGKTGSQSVDVIINSGLSGENIALNKTITTVSMEEEGFPAQNVLDGDTFYWKATGLPQWIEIDLEANFDITGMELFTNDYNPYQFQIETKLNNEDEYVLLSDKSGNETGSNIFADYSEATARYLKVLFTGTHENIQDFVALEEIKVYGTENTTVDVKGISIAQNSVSIKVYPNPAINGSISFETFGFEQNEKLNCSIYSVLGKKIFEKNFSGVERKAVILQVEDLNPGIYLLQVNGKNENTYTWFCLE